MPVRTPYPRNQLSPRGPIVFGIWRPWALEIREGLAQYARRKRWPDLLPLWSEMGNPAGYLAQVQARGALLEVDPGQVASLQALRIPVVNLVIQNSHDVPFPSLALDEEAIGTLAGRHLLDQGCRTFAYAGPEHPMSFLRGQGFSRVLDRAGARAEELRVSGHLPSWQDFSQLPLLRDWLRKLPKPAGVLAFNDEIARRILEACRSGRISVPDAVAVVGVDNDATQQALSPLPLTSVIPDWKGLGYRAAGLMDRLLAGSKPDAVTLTLPPAGLAVRRSSQRRRDLPQALEASLKFIADNIGEGIRVSDLAEAEGLSRSALNRAFMKHLGRRPGEEIRTRRLEAAAQLLKTTALPVVDISVQTGYQSLSYMSKAFRARWGLSPLEYRRLNAGALLLPLQPGRN